MDNLATAIALFAAATVVILLAGTRLAAVADALADRTNLGEAFVGAVLLGACTSLSGLTTSAVAASHGLAELAVSNAFGGIAAQTAFLVVADLFYRRANLEHAAASLENVVYGVMLVGLLAIPLWASVSPDFTIGPLHPASLLLFVAYLGGVRLARQAREAPMWSPRTTSETRIDTPDGKLEQKSLPSLVISFLVLAALTLAGGFVIAQSGESLIAATGLSQGVVGALFTAVATSAPELVTTVAAVRRGALTLAVGGILGGNAFDVLFIAVADGFYAPGSIYHAVGPTEVFWASLTIAMTAVLLLGLLARQREGAGRIGFEGVIVLLLYATGVIAMFV